MNKLLIGGGVAAAIAFLFFRSKSEQAPRAQEEQPKQDAPPVAPPTVQEPKVLDTEIGEGAELVRKRMIQLNNSIDGERIKQSSRTDPYQGLSFQPGIKQIITELYGSPINYPAIPQKIEPSFYNWLGNVATAPNFEELTSTMGIDKAKEIIKKLMTYGSLTFWPSNMDELVNANYFGTATKADKNKSERYNAAAEDLKNFATNLQEVTRQYGQNLENRAILDLESAGYKFIGI